MKIDWFALAQELAAPERAMIETAFDPHEVESNDTFAVLDPEFDQ